MLSLEQTLLSTYMWADLQLTEEETNKIKSIELQEECFKEHYHKLIVKTINHLRAKNEPYYLEYVVDEMRQEGNFNEFIFEEIMFTNQVTANTFINYYNGMVERETITYHGGI